MGTLFTITLYATNQASAQSAAEAAFQRVAALEETMSDYQADSELMRLCEQPAGTPVRISTDLFDVLQQAQKFSELSQGAFDVTVGPYVRLWRFSRKRKILPEPAEIAQARAAVGWKKLRLDALTRTATLLVPNMRLDLGGIGKGYAADQALKSLKQKGINRGMVAASGDIAIGDAPPGQKGWKVGIANMDSNNNGITRTVYLRNAGVSTSGDTEQFVLINGIRYSHIVDPRTGVGLTNRIQVTVIAPNATTSDALAKPVSVIGVKPGLALVDSLPGTSAFILLKNDDEVRSFVSRRWARSSP
jgi:thiamine biosynthesis lipoprotein